MKFAVSIVLLALIALSGCGQQPLWHEGTFAEIQADAQKSGKNILIDFWSPT
jgi:hypothetical protein